MSVDRSLDLLRSQSHAVLRRCCIVYVLESTHMRHLMQHDLDDELEGEPEPGRGGFEDELYTLSSIEVSSLGWSSAWRKSSEL